MKIVRQRNQTALVLALCLGAGVPNFAQAATSYGGLAFGNDRFVAIVVAGGTVRALTSTDGQSWTTAAAVFSSGQVGRISACSFSNDRFLSGHGWGQASRSSDAINWTYLTWVGNQQVFDFEYGSGTYVAVWELFNGQNVSTSTDGIFWTQRSSGLAQNLYSLAFGNGTFVAVGDVGTIATSPNGVNWSARTSGTTQNLYASAYGAGLFVAVGSAGTILTSTNATNWIGRDSSTGYNLLDVAYGDGVFAAVGDAGTILISTNGSNWTSRSSGTSVSLDHIAYGNGTFVTMGNGPVLKSSLDWFIPIPLSAALDTTNLVWTTGGNAGWSGQTNETHDGVDAARSGPITDFRESWLQTAVAGPGTLAFRWKVSSEMDWDFLEFSIDSVIKSRISGEENWKQQSFEIAPGTHQLRWRYAKDDSTFKGQDAAWVDEVVFTSASGPPVIVAQPITQRVGLGDTVTFTAGVGGAKPRMHQWFKDENPIPGATNVSLTLSNVALVNEGSYRLAVANSVGSTTTSNALLALPMLGPVQTVLLFSDEPSSSPYRTALINLGRTHQGFGDSVAFNNAVLSANPMTTLVVVDAPTTNAPFNAVAEFANAGGRAILEYWAMGADSALAVAFDASVVQALLPSPQPVYDWGGSQFFTGLSSPIAFVDRFSFSGQRLQPTVGGQAVAGFTSAPMFSQAAIVIGHSGRTIINGCLLVEITDVNVRVRLAQNEIDYFYRGLTIVAQPTSQVVPQGSDATFAVTALSPYGPLAYQWRLNGTNLPTATNSILVVSNAQALNEGVYSVVVFDTQSSLTSSNVTLYLHAAPALAAPVPPLKLSAILGERVTLGIQVEGTLPMFCRWRVFRASGGQQALSDQILTQRVSFLSFTSALNSAGAYVVHLTNIVGGSLTQSLTNAVLTLLADSDGDGLPDEWEEAYSACADPALDCDNDGLTNLEEYQAGTDPTDAASALKFDRIAAGNSATLEFQAVSNKTYTVQHSSTLASNSWLKLVDVVARKNNRTETVIDPASATHRFYRLVTPRQP